MEFVPVLALLALVKKFIDFGKYLTNRDVNGVVTQLGAWGAGVLGVLLAAQTEWATGITVGDVALSTLSFWSIVFVGLTIGSGSGLAADFFSAKQGVYEVGRLHMISSPTRKRAARSEVGAIGNRELASIAVALAAIALIVVLIFVV